MRMTLNLWFSSLSTGITGRHCRAWLTLCWAWSPGPCTCPADAPPASYSPVLEAFVLFIFFKRWFFFLRSQHHGFISWDCLGYPRLASNSLHLQWWPYVPDLILLPLFSQGLGCMSRHVQLQRVLFSSVSSMACCFYRSPSISLTGELNDGFY